MQLIVILRLSWEDIKNIHNEDENLINYDTSWTTEQHIYVYTAMLSILTVIVSCRAFTFYKMCLRISRNLHDQMFRGVTRTLMSFFNQNPSGRILNRFSKDVGTVDSSLPICVIDCMKFFLELAGVSAIVVSTNYWMIFPTLTMCGIFYGLRFVFLTTARNVKRVEAISESTVCVI